MIFPTTIIGTSTGPIPSDSFFQLQYSLQTVRKGCLWGRDLTSSTPSFSIPNITEAPSSSRVIDHRNLSWARMLGREDAKVSLVVRGLFCCTSDRASPDFWTAIRQMYALLLQSMIPGQVLFSAYLFWCSPLSPLHLTYVASLPG
jgi:hypothetical protein